MAKRPTISVIIPALNDATHLVQALERVSTDPRVEVIVVNGGVPDVETAALEGQHPHVRWARSAAGRGRQMNVGAAYAQGEWLVFLHADTRLPSGWLEELESVERDPKIVGGSFRFRLDSGHPWARLIERGVAARVRCFDLPYGDQALFVRRQVFDSLGGYREVDLMEDVEFVRRLSKAGRLHHSALSVVTSARRWERDGWIRRSGENLVLLVLYFLGISPRRLAGVYRREREKAHDGQAQKP
jgi:rSAM/selenodomain-associated transferase 2